MCAQLSAGKLPRMREQGNVLVIVAFFMLALLMLLMVLLDDIQVNQARMLIDAAVQAAAVDGARADPSASLLVPPCSGGACPSPARVLSVRNDEVTEKRVRVSLERELASVAYLMDGTTPAQVAASAEIAIVTPGGAARCQPSPFPGPQGCYLDPFVAVRVTVPIELLWGAFTFKYQSVAIGGATDNALEQLPATPIPTALPVVVPTWVVPPPTCDPTMCS